MIKVKIPKNIRFVLPALSNSSGKDIVFTINNLTSLMFGSTSVIFAFLMKLRAALLHH
jgi:hypothetical protein